MGDYYGHTTNSGGGGGGRGRDFRGGRQGHGGGGGGGRYGGGGGVGGDRDPRPGLEQSGIEVRTNMYPLQFTQDGEKVWYKYRIEIAHAVRRPEKDEHGEIVRGPDGRMQFDVVEKVDKQGERKLLGRRMMSEERAMTDSSVLSRRVLRKLQRTLLEDKNEYIFADGACFAYAPQELSGLVVPRAMTNEDGQVLAPEAARVSHDVAIKAECEDDEDDAEMIKNKWFIVTLFAAGEITFVVQDGKIVMNQAKDKIEEITHAVNILVRSSQLNTMLAFGQAPGMFVYKMHEQAQGVLGDDLVHAIRGSFGDCQPVLGLLEAARFSGNWNLLLSVDLGIRWLRPEKMPLHHGGGPIPILDPNHPSIAGVHITSVSQKLSSVELENVKRALQALPYFNIKFKYGPEWARRQKEERGKDDSFIKKFNYSVRRNRRLYVRTEDNSPSIKATPADHTFEIPSNDAETTREVNVEQYLKERYDVHLKYPKMPLIRISRDEWFPIEFLFQALCEMKHANRDDQKAWALKFNDNFATKRRVDALTALLSNTKLDHTECQREFLARFDLQRSLEPKLLKAKVMQQPVLEFAHGKRANIRDGSWNLLQPQSNHPLMFFKPADLPSYAVVDFCGGGRPSAVDSMAGIFEACERHGILIGKPFAGPDKEFIDWLTHTPSGHLNGPSDFYTSMDEAAEKARDVYLRDKTEFFQSHNAFFRTIVRNRNLENEAIVPSHGYVAGASLLTCLVDHRFVADEMAGIMLEKDKKFATHLITVDGKEVESRLVYRIEYEGKIHHVDPFDVQITGDRRTPFDIFLPNREHPVRFEKVEIVYQVGEHFYRNVSDSQVQPLIVVSFTNVECPSLLFAYIREKETQIYNLIKLSSNADHGIQSQVIVQRSVEKQKNPHQYYSNVALKINAKLSNDLNRARAWEPQASQSSNDFKRSRISGSLPWISEVPTMVMGFVTASGQGENGLMIAVGSVCLDNGGMRMLHDGRFQARDRLINRKAIGQITENLAIGYFNENGRIPQRVVVFRGGGHDGLFYDMICQEVQGIRSAFYRLNATQDDNPRCEVCATNETDGCNMCTPKITFVACQDDHGMRIVPEREWKDRTKVPSNVPSGTCLDDRDHLLLSSLNSKLLDKETESLTGISSNHFFLDPGESAANYLLVSHGGLKGTSKPIYYRTILNENAVLRPAAGEGTPLLKSKLQELTYAMAFQYGTASKAPRSIPLLHYGAKLAGTALAYGPCLISSERSDGLKLDADLKIYVNSHRDGRILPSFGSLGDADDWRLPFRPHNTA